MTTPKLDEARLRELADRCMIGDPWYTSHDLITQSYGSLLPQDRAFIAAANPATILALLDALSAERERGDRAVKTAADLVSGWGVVEPHVQNLEIINHSRTGVGYSGPTDFADALTNARAFLATQKAEGAE